MERIQSAQHISESSGSVRSQPCSILATELLYIPEPTHAHFHQHPSFYLLSSTEFKPLQMSGGIGIHIKFRIMHLYNAAS